MYSLGLRKGDMYCHFNVYETLWAAEHMARVYAELGWTPTITKVEGGVL